MGFAPLEGVWGCIPSYLKTHQELGVRGAERPVFEGIDCHHPALLIAPGQSASVLLSTTLQTSQIDDQVI